MQKNIILLLTSLAILISLTGCGEGSTSPSSTTAANNEETETEKTETEVVTTSATASSKLLNSYQALVEISLSHRVKALRLFEAIEEKEVLSGADLDALHHLTLNQLSLKDEIAAYIAENQHLVNEAGSYTEKERMERVMISLSALLLRYDNYLISYINYENDTKLRQFLNDPDSAYDIPANTLSDMTNMYNDLGHRTDVQDMIDFYNENIEVHAEVSENFFLYLKMLIDQSPSYQLGFENDTDYALLNLNSLYISTLDLGEDGLTLAVNELSKTLGNTAGLVETRRGKLDDNETVTNHVHSVIQAGDILLEKTPFRLTDQLIPGHWGHAAVYVGTQEELVALGIWDHPVVIPFQQDIIDGKLVDEALRDDVQLNTIEHFLNVDDLAIMHDRTETDEAKADRIILALRQLGKEYDFNFDIETSVKIVCSELIYVTSIFIDWVTEEIVGINTISPDNVAVKSIEEKSIFDITLLYHDGLEVKTDKKIEMKRLLEEAEEEE